jgi:predicted acylesterase/phospholipase RssA
MICPLLLLLLLVLSNATEQISFSGGGAFGAVEIGILKRILSEKSKKYDRYTGISAGGLNSGFLSYYSNINDGVKAAEIMYSNLRNNDVYEILPITGNSLLNTQPLYKTLKTIIRKMTNEPVIETMIGAVNLYTGNLDTYMYDSTLHIEDKIKLLMSTSAIPVVFPPIKFKDYMYVDGGTLSNELLDIIHSSDYLNITYITPYDTMIEDDSTIDTIEEMVMRIFRVVKHNYNNPISQLNQNCKTPYGEINYYYVPQTVLSGYSMLNFNKGAELIDIGYMNTRSKKYKLC